MTRLLPLFLPSVVEYGPGVRGLCLLEMLIELMKS
jgi:hypothetical protein